MASGFQTNKNDLGLILNEIESLPTLSSVAVRVLELSGRDDAEVKEISALIESDPALAARILSMCRRADRATSNDIVRIDRAVVQLGMDAVRAALLSVELFGVINGDESAQGECAFDREGFWRHSLGVACASEQIALAHRDELGINPGAAFIAGLVHDLGKLALHWVLPKAYGRVLNASGGSRTDLAALERRALGVDHFVAGKRLAEHWRLPHVLQDVMWLHAQPEEAVPVLPHRAVVGIVGTADALVRSLHIGWSGEGAERVDLETLCASWSMDVERVRGVGGGVHGAVSERAKALGFGDEPGEALLLQSIGRANQRLGSMAAALELRARDRVRLSSGIDAISKFASESAGASSIAAMCGAVMRSAEELAESTGERGTFAVFWRSREGGVWRLFGGNRGRDASEHVLGSQPAEGGFAFGASRSGELTLGDTAFLRWARQELESTCGSDCEITFVPVLNRGGAVALLAHDRGALREAAGDDVLASLAAVWGMALMGTGQHAGARGVSERLAETNMRLAEAQSALVEGRSMAMLGRLTAGAAHEMNNPLMVISGNAQKLHHLVRGDEAMDATVGVIEASEKLSDLIGALHMLASPPEPKFAGVRAGELVDGAVSIVVARYGEAARERIVIDTEEGLPDVWVDGGQMRQVIAELVLNGLESDEDAKVRVMTRFGDRDGRVDMRIVDTGPGMGRKTLEHACDPFYSHREAGRGVGLGLARSRRFAEMNGCEWKLNSEVGVGTSAEIGIPHRRAENAASGRAA